MVLNTLIKTKNEDYQTSMKLSYNLAKLYYNKFFNYKLFCFRSREVYNAICLRLGDTLHIPEDSVKALFNDMHLFPSDSQGNFFYTSTKLKVLFYISMVFKS